MRRTVPLLISILPLVVGCGEEPTLQFNAAVRLPQTLADDLTLLEFFVYGPDTTDGTKLNCDMLMDQREPRLYESPTDGRLDLLQQWTVDAAALNAGTGFTTVIPKVPAGDARIIYVQGKAGAVVIAKGCKENVVVPEGKRAALQVIDVYDVRATP